MLIERNKICYKSKAGKCPTALNLSKFAHLAKGQCATFYWSQVHVILFSGHPLQGGQRVVFYW